MGEPLASDLALLRLLLDDREMPYEFSDVDLTVLFNAAGDLVYLAAADGWTVKASKLASLVDQTESGSTKSLSQMHRQALAQADALRRQATTSPGGGDEVSDPFGARVVSLRRVASDDPLLSGQWPPVI